MTEFLFTVIFSRLLSRMLKISVKHARKAKKRFRDASVNCTEAPSNGLRDLAGPWNWVVWKKCKQEHLIFSKFITIFSWYNLSWLLMWTLLKNNSSNHYTEKCVSCIFDRYLMFSFWFQVQIRLWKSVSQEFAADQDDFVVIVKLVPDLVLCAVSVDGGGGKKSETKFAIKWCVSFY